MVHTRHEYNHLFDFFVPIGLAVFAIVTGAILFALIRYRRGRRDVPSGRSDAPVAELVYVVVLAGIVAVLVSLTFNTEAKVDRVASKSPALEVDVTAAKWTWRFFYPAYGITILSADVKPATLVVPAGQVVRFHLVSRDVIHSFYVPELRFKRDAFPGKPTVFDLVFDGGRFMGECAEFCGLHHADMRFSVEGLPASAFLGWAEAHRPGAGP